MDFCTCTALHKKGKHGKCRMKMIFWILYFVSIRRPYVRTHAPVLSTVSGQLTATQHTLPGLFYSKLDILLSIESVHL